ncbi:putative DNA recombinase [Gottschalkia purinilytica]|uniref:Putative DNA recombinase n=1 Tax=Gottschalkia purinilytica TaxID=1503 RepID=A0A0L0W7R4_GOTPU|nr:recombinase family protein [Gottschalkia purinilytica]KNF07584.1 putative DNA recombinase [Gottschalkia purinilytica]
MKIAIYSRKSKLTNKGESTQNQIQLCEEYANKHFKVDEFIIYEDEGFSGGSSDRPQYKKMIRDANKKKFNILMCYRLDRISRSISDFSNTIELLQSNNISFISIREQFDTSTPMGRAMMYIASVFAQLERETIAERIKDNMLRLSRSGRWLGGKTPTGYGSEPIEYYDENMNKKVMYKLKEIPKEISIVKMIFKKYLELKSLNQVEVWSVTNNIKTPNGNYFDVTGVRGILTNMVYVKADENMYKYCRSLNMDIASDKSEFDGIHGLMVYNKTIEKKGRANKLRCHSEWIVAVGKHKGIISSTDFISTQNLIQNNKLKSPKTISSKIGLLSTFLKCNICESKMRTIYGNKRKDGTRSHYYKCKLKEISRGLKCNSKNLPGKEVDKLVLNEIRKLNLDYNKLLKSLLKKKDYIISLNDLYATKSSTLEKEVQKYERMIENLTLKLSETLDSKSSKYIISQIEALDKKINEVKISIEKINKEKKFTLNELKTLESLKDLVRSFNKSIYEFEYEEKVILLSKLVNDIIWDGNNLEIRFSSELNKNS